MEGAQVAKTRSAAGGVLWDRPRAGDDPLQLPRAQGLRFPLTAPLASSSAAAAEISCPGNDADPSRGSSPRPRSPTPPLCWGSRVGQSRGGGSSSLGQGAAGGSRAAGHGRCPPCDAVFLSVIPPRLPGPRLAEPSTMLLPGHARPPPASQPAQHPGLRRQVEPPGQLLRLFYCTVLVCSKEIAALTDFSGKSTRPRRAPLESSGEEGRPRGARWAGLKLKLPLSEGSP